MKRNLTTQRGFTLIEMITVVAIIAILSSMAILYYDRYTRDSTRAAAKTALENLSSLVETYYSNNKTYQAPLTSLGFTSDPAFIDKSGQNVAAGSADAVYQISLHTSQAGNMVYCATCDFEVVAVPQGGQTQDTDCATLWLDSLGQKGDTGTKSATPTYCW